MPDNVRRGRPQGKRHRDRTACGQELRLLPQVRVKRCGKSAPRTRQRGRHGKPHREQNRIGTTLTARAGRGRFLGLVVRVGCSRRAAMRVPEEWPSRRGSDPPAIQNPAYRPAGIFPLARSAPATIAARSPERVFERPKTSRLRGSLLSASSSRAQPRSGLPGTTSRFRANRRGAPGACQPTTVSTSILPLVACE